MFQTQYQHCRWCESCGHVLPVICESLTKIEQGIKKLFKKYAWGGPASPWWGGLPMRFSDITFAVVKRFSNFWEIKKANSCPQVSHHPHFQITSSKFREVASNERSPHDGEASPWWGGLPIRFSDISSRVLIRFSNLLQIMKAKSCPQVLHLSHFQMKRSVMSDTRSPAGLPMMGSSPWWGGLPMRFSAITFAILIGFSIWLQIKKVNSCSQLSHHSHFMLRECNIEKTVPRRSKFWRSQFDPFFYATPFFSSKKHENSWFCIL